jgi:uncharacterized membrane protein
MSSQRSTSNGRRSLAGVVATAAFAALTLAGSGPASAAGEPAASEPDPPALTTRGFLRDRDGEFTTIVPPGAVSTKTGGLSDRGEVVGIGYPRLDGNGGGFGFLRDRAGDYTTFVFPGTGPESRTVAADINNRGQIAGWSDDGVTGFGYIRDRSGDFTKIEHPDASGTTPVGLGAEISGTDIRGINDRGEVVGNYAADGTIHGFFRDRKGNFTTVDPPGAAATFLAGLNDKGEIVGGYSKVGPEDLLVGAPRGFLLSKRRYEQIAFPGALVTFPNGITNGGEIAGAYVDDDGTTHGFVRSKRGAYTSIDNPDAGGLGTAVYAINEREATTGAYVSPVGEARAGRQALGAFNTPAMDLLSTLAPIG